MKIKIAIIDDHPLILEGMKTMMDDQKSIEISCGFTSVIEFENQLLDLNVDILLLDISMPEKNGIDLCKLVTHKRPDIQIIALTNHKNPSYIKQMIKYGAQGYLLKNSSKDEMIELIKRVYHSSDKQLPDSVKNLLINDSVGGGKKNYAPKLTRREKEILELIANEHTNQEIADILFITSKTVENHRSNLFQKLGAKNAAGLIRLAYEYGFL
jgi:DNA-binding NarL/FixJ family response regulator